MNNKNRRNKLRKIVVNNIQYFWSITDTNCDGDGGSRFQIWKDKTKIHEELTHEEAVTPKLVRKRILIINKNDPE